MKYLIINADDFGYCPKRDRAIMDLFHRQCLSSTSVLINGMNVQQACTAAKAMRLPMGIHLNLTEGQPISTDIDRIRSLVDSQGYFHGKFGLRNELEKDCIEIEHVEYEIRMQLKRYFQLMDDQSPEHIDGHQHIHVHPKLVEIIARLAREYEIEYIRVPFDRMVTKENRFYQEIVNQSQEAKSIFDRYGLVYADEFLGMTIMGEDFIFDKIDKCLGMFEEREHLLMELMCHPGYPSDPQIGGCGNGQPDLFSQSQGRLIEYEFLLSCEWKSLLNKYHFHLCYGRKFHLKFSKGTLNDDEANVDANHYE